MKKIIIKRIIGIFLALFFASLGPLLFVCMIMYGSPGLFDYEYDVGNGSYTLHRSSADWIIISPKDGFKDETEEIPRKVVEVAWNDQYVIAKQYGMKRENPDSTYEIADETVVNYWILDTENKKRYGPYTYYEFLIKKQEFNLQDLQLKPVRSYIESK